MSYTGPRRKTKSQKVGFTIDEKSLEAINDALDEVPDKLRNKLSKKGLRKAAKLVADQVRIVVPIGKMKRLKKATKARSAKRSRVRIGMIVRIESPVAANLNYGTEHIEGKDFLGEAFKAKADEATAALIDSIRELVAELNGK